MHVHDLTPFIGVELTGVTYDQLRDPEVFDRVADGLRERDLVVIREIEMSPAEQIELATRLGRPVPFVLKEFRHPDFDEILVSSNESEAGRPLGIPRVGNFWHQDSSFTSRPAEYTMLHGVRVPHTTGHTLFASAVDVFERLPEAWRDKLRGRTGLHTLTKQQRIAPEHVGLSIAEMKALVAQEYPAVSHPVVAREEATGREYLYATPEYMDSVVGFDANENAAFFDLVNDVVQEPSRVYTHRWMPGDLLVWKTATVYHVATEVAPGTPRTVHRISITDRAN